jgi:hypothetical protein
VSGQLLAAPDDLLCCIAAANTGGDQCTCWVEVLAYRDPAGDLQAVTEQEPLQEGPACARRLACGDCAYRAGSPERDGDGGAVPSFRASQPFYCHDGMPLVVAYLHPSGALRTDPLEAGVADYHPRMRARIAYRVDGRPGVLCAGWAAVNGIHRADPAVTS